VQQTEPGSSDPRVTAGFRAFSRGAGALAIGVALLVLVGWAWDIPDLKRLLTRGVEMKVNTALGMLLTGAALVCCQSSRLSMQRLSGLLSLAVLVLGGVTLAQFLSSWDAGIDTLWRADPAALLLGRPPGRMSQLSAVAFVLLGGAGITNCRLGWVVWAQVLTLGAIAIALYALSAFGYHGMDGGGSFIHPVALPSALLFLLLSLGWLAARPGVGLMRVLAARSFGGALARRALLPSVLVPTMLSYFAQALQERGVLSPDSTIMLLAVTSGGLVAWIIWTVSVLLDRVEREQRITSHLREDANTDPLTQLANRRAFQTAIQGLLRRRREEDAVFSLLMLDLDRFKAFNDAHGHVAGDQALRLVGHLLKSALRPGDVAARYGGEEFAILLPETTAAQAQILAERIREAASNLVFEKASQQCCKVTVSVGIGEYPANCSDRAGLLRAAEGALYQAKTRGRNIVAKVNTCQSIAFDRP